MRCPNCHGKLQFAVKVECGKFVTLPAEQIIRVNPKKPFYEFTALTAEPKPKPKHLKAEKIGAVEPIVKPVKPLKLVTLQNAKIELYWCPECRIFIKAVK